MTLNDRFTKGFLAGIAGGIAIDIMDFSSSYLGITEKTFWDWSGTLIFGFRPKSVNQIMLAIAGQLFFSALMGIVFVYLIPNITSKNLYLKGWVYGLLVWFSSYVLTVFFKVAPLTPIYFDTAASDFVSASVYGLVLVYTLKRLEERTRV